MSCSCPDSATMCKHVAAAMYGVGARFDRQPELLFTLRRVEQEELIAQATAAEVSRRGNRKTIASEELGSVFGIDLAEAPPAPTARARPPGRKARSPVSAKKRGRKTARS